MEDIPEEVGLFETNLHSLPLIARGKVRDNYAVGTDRILMVASDRLSAFDVVMREPIPGKGKILTEMALFWFDKLKHVVPNHLTGDDPESVVAEDEREQVRGRSMLVRRLRPLPIEAVVRGYLAGSAWKEYQASGSVCGVPLPPGLQNASKLPAPIFTPATKAAMGAHDENIEFARMCEIVGADLAAQVRDISISLYREAAEYALTKGIIIADTKFEFGLDNDLTLTLMDEILTPDSSRFWPSENYVEGRSPPSLDKQVARDWLEGGSSTGQAWNKQEPPPKIPIEIVFRMACGYREALNRLQLARKTKFSALNELLQKRVLLASGGSDRNSAMAELCIYYSRVGNVYEAELLLKKLFSECKYGLRDTVWRNISEALYDHYTGTGVQAVDKLMRAHALSIAGQETRLRALSAVWLAHVLIEKERLETIRDYAAEAFENSTVSDHAIRSRGNLIVGDMLLSADREDLAAPWHIRARRHAFEEGDDATISAIAFNTALMRVSKFRRMTLQGLPILDSESIAVTYSQNAISVERLLGTQAMPELGPLQNAQVLSLRGDFSQALPLLHAFAHSTTVSSANRMRAEWSSDIAWCYSRLGDYHSANEWAQRTIDEIVPDVHVDDLAALHSRLTLVYRSTGNRTKEDFHYHAAVAGWANYEASQQRVVNIFGTVQPCE